MAGLGVRAGGAVTVLATIAVLAARIFLVHNALSGHTYSVRFPQTRAADPAAPASAWLFFATRDDATQIRTLHATLLASAVPGAVAGMTAASKLELRATSAASQTVIVTLGAPTEAACNAIDGIAAGFDRAAPQHFDAGPKWQDGTCVLTITPVDVFVQGLLNAQTLVLQPHGQGIALPAPSWTVAGLSWNPS